MKLLTIAIPAYNVENYLNNCLNSLVKVSAYEKLEVLIINDGSTDSTAEIAENFAARYPDFITLINKKNGGHGSAINTALSIASGKYFIVVDGDDRVDSTALDQFISIIENTDADLISTNYKRIDINNGKSIPVIHQNINYNVIYSFEELEAHDIYFALANSCFKTRILTENKITLQENTFYVDVEYILLPIPFIQTVLFINLYIYKYYVGNTQQSIYTPTMVKRYSHHERVLKRIICYFDSMQLTEGHKVYIEKMIKQLLYTHYSIALIHNPDKQLGCQQAKEFDLFLKQQSNKWYFLAEKTIPILYVIRRYHYDYNKFQKSIFYVFRNSHYYINFKKLYFKMKLNKLYIFLKNKFRRTRNVL